MTIRDLMLYHYKGYEIHIDLTTLRYSCQLPGQARGEITGLATEAQCQDAIDALLEPTRKPTDEPQAA